MKSMNNAENVIRLEKEGFCSNAKKDGNKNEFKMMSPWYFVSQKKKKKSNSLASFLSRAVFSIGKFKLKKLSKIYFRLKYSKKTSTKSRSVAKT